MAFVAYRVCRSIHFKWQLKGNGIRDSRAFQLIFLYGQVDKLEQQQHEDLRVGSKKMRAEQEKELKVFRYKWTSVFTAAA